MIFDYFSQLVSHADFTTALIFLAVAYITWKVYDGRNLPPGPRGLPVVGYLPFMGSAPPEQTFKNLSKKYGEIISVYFGNRLMVVLNNYELIKEAYIKNGDVFSGRPHGTLLKIDEGDAGVFVSDGEPWREQRRFILTTLRDYGMGKLSLEPRVMEEVHFFLNELAKKKGQPFDIMHSLGMSTANIISTLEFGRRFDYNEKEFLRMREIEDEAFLLFNTSSPRTFFPWLDYIPFTDFITHSSKLRQLDHEFKKFISNRIDEHKAEYNENSRKDLIDAYLTERNEMIQKVGNYGYFTDHENEGSLTLLFSAGAETTTTTLRWGLLLMMIHPEIQKKVQNEIDESIGLERDPTMSDRSSMVYTDAVLLEIQRFASIVPLNVPHANLEETTLGGYRIPKRAVILTNLWAVHHDPALWDQPEKFMPERFIKDGKITRPEHLIPFGIGKRSCVGESLARMELFLYFTSLLQRFTFQAPKGVTPALNIESAFTRRPKHYDLCAIQRPGYSVLNAIKQ